MSNWFECTLKYDKIQENGSVKTVSEHFLVDALSFTEAEARITEEQRPFISGEFSILAVKRSRISEIAFNDEGDKWYLAKIGLIDVDPKTGNEKRNIHKILIQASGFKSAYDNLITYMKGTMADFDIVSITETPLIDVYRMKVVD